MLGDGSKVRRAADHPSIQPEAASGCKAVRAITTPLASSTKPVTITITATPGASSANASCYAVEDALPAGWSVSSINNSGKFDRAKGR